MNTRFESRNSKAVVRPFQSTILYQKSKIYLALSILLIAAVACSMPGFGRKATPQAEASPQAASATTSIPTSPPAQPTPTPQPLPPAVVESSPPVGAEVPLNGNITIYFNQPMQPESVEAALTLPPEAEGEVTWENDSTMVIDPAVELQPEQDITINLDDTAQSADGNQLLAEVSLEFRTAGYLRLLQVLPDRSATEVDPTGAVVAAFNRPVVPLGADPEGLPAAFSLDPPADGRAEWLNNSTYIFYPQPGLEGGKTYNITINPDLKGVDGNPLLAPDSWSFTTALPEVSTLTPAPDSSSIRLDTPITVTFNVPMDPASVEASFALLGPDGAPAAGSFAWTPDYTAVGFRPASPLERSAAYTAVVGAEAQARGGTPLNSEFRSNLYTVTPLRVETSTPAPGGLKPQYEGVVLRLSAPVRDRNLDQYVSVSPRLPNQSVYWDEMELTLYVWGDYAPDSAYTLRLSPDLPDPWGGTLGQEYVLPFSTEPQPPSLNVATFADVLFLTPQDASMKAQATNYYQVPVSAGSLPLNDFFSLASGENAYEMRQNYQPADQVAWTQSLPLTPNRSQFVDLYISSNQTPRPPGLYFMRVQMPREQNFTATYLLAVSNVQMTFKLGATDALVWAVDLRTYQPVTGAPVTIFDQSGNPLADGTTDEQGVMRTAIPPAKDPYSTFYAVMGQPGAEGFGLAVSTWNQGLSSWDFGIPTDYSGPHLEAYLYTDRPMYRPGQTVYFRAVVRQAFNGRYQLPSLADLPLTLYRDYGDEMLSFELPISAFGTAHGEYTIPADARPGYYRLASKLDENNMQVQFQVADYRKPEINLSVSLDKEQALIGETLQATVNARYFFDAPAANVLVRYALYARQEDFALAGYNAGIADTSWLRAHRFPFSFGGVYLGDMVTEGTAYTGPDGLLVLDLPTQSDPGRRLYTLEVTAQDETGLPVSARTTAIVNPSAIYLGVRSDAWTGRAETPSGFEVLAVDWNGDPAGAHTLSAEFQKVEWIRTDPPPEQLYFEPTYEAQYTFIGSSNFQTGEQGKARLEFTPPEPGTYLLQVSGENALTEVLLWVTGPGEPVWPNLPNQRLQITADRSEYAPGDTAQVFIPNPFPTPVQALIVVERSAVLRHQVTNLEPGGATIELPLSSEDSPNVYLSVTLLAADETGAPSHRQGYVDLAVTPLEQTLNVTLTTQPQRLGPGEDVTFEVQVSDSVGQPVQGEFSLAVVDLAALALADPNAPDIVPAFYGKQPLGVRMGMSLAAYANARTLQVPGVGGGGGGDGMVGPVVRERFPDTAVWLADIVTGEDGRAAISAPLPDSLTTWQVVLRGVTEDTRVGQAEAQIIASKDLLVRPVTPHFLVAGDHVQLAALVQNNTATDLQADVGLQASGFNPDDPSLLSQSVLVPANGRARVEWWGTVQDVSEADLVFTAFAQDGSTSYQDATRPTGGRLRVLRYTAPFTFRTSGILDEPGELLELVSLPRSFDPGSGSLKVELSSSLASAMLASLEALEPETGRENTETLTSRFLANLETSRTLREFSVDNPALQAEPESAIQADLGSLLNRQRAEGGWEWWEGGEMDPFISAYALLGLSRARQAGLDVPDPAMQRAIDFLTAGLWTPEMASDDWQIDRLAFLHYVLSQAGAPNSGGPDSLYAVRERLSPWGQALLALTLEDYSPGGEAARTLLSDLAGNALRSSTGVHWEDKENNWRNMGTTISTSSMVLSALAQRDPASPLVADAVRYLAAHRQADGGWSTSYSTAWSIMALAQVMKGTGELGGAFAFSASLNGAPLASGAASSAAAPVSAEAPVSSLYPDYPNALRITHEAGTGRLYYTAGLNVSRPVEDVQPLQEGVTISRAYYPYGMDCVTQVCAPLQEAAPGQRVQVRISLTVDQDAFYLLVEDYIPAGAEVLDTSLKTSQLGSPELPPDTPPGPLFDPRRPFDGGWGWWNFSGPRIYDDHVAWSAQSLPAGSYELTYTLVILQPGEYRVLPARAWQLYFPEVQGNSAGALFAIRP